MAAGLVTVAAMAGAVLGAGCSSSDAEGAGLGGRATEGTGDPAADSLVDVVAPDLEGQVDEVITMIPPGVGGKSPDMDMFGGGTLVSARHLLQAPQGDGGMVDLWIMRVRNPQMGPGLQECRVTVADDGSGGAGCSSLADAARPGGEQSLVQGMMGDEDSFTVELGGPPDMTHFIATVGDRRIGVVPIEGQALLYLEGDCPAGLTVTGWRGDEQIGEAQNQFC